MQPRASTASRDRRRTPPCGTIRGREPWIDRNPAYAALQRDYLGPALAAHLRATGVDRTVIIQASDTVEETGFMVACARDHPFIAGVVGWLPLDDPRATERQLAIYEADPIIVGFRHLIVFERDPDFCIRPTVIESLRLVAERGYTWDSNASTARHLEHVAVLAERIPALKQVIDHLGKPVFDQGLDQPWTTLMTRAAAVRT